MACAINSAPRTVGPSHWFPAVHSDQEVVLNSVGGLISSTFIKNQPVPVNLIKNAFPLAFTEFCCDSVICCKYHKRRRCERELTLWTVIFVTLQGSWGNMSDCECQRGKLNIYEEITGGWILLFNFSNPAMKYYYSSISPCEWTRMD